MNEYIFRRYEESEAYEKKGDHDPRTFVFIVKQLVGANKLKHSTKLTAQIVTALVCCYSKTHYSSLFSYISTLPHFVSNICYQIFLQSSFVYVWVFCYQGI